MRSKRSAIWRTIPTASSIPLLGDLRKTVQSADRSMQTLDDTLQDARPGVQNFSKNTLPEIGQATRDLRALTESLSNVANGSTTKAR